MIRTIRLRDGETQHQVVVREDGAVEVNGETAITVTAGDAGAVRAASAPMRRIWAAASDDVRWVFIDGEVYRFEVEREGRRKRAHGHHGSLTAPMPATVLRVQAAVGDAVRKGEPLVILEAMKMELPVRAPADGRVTAVHCREGELVQPGVVLVEIDETDAA